MKYIFSFLFLTSLCAAEPAKAPKQPPVVFNTPKPACSLIDGKLVLVKAWPIGSWEDCAYAALSLAIQMDNQKADIIKKAEQTDAQLAKCEKTNKK